MRIAGVLAAATLVAALMWMRASGQDPTDEQLARHRNLGKAFYENPTTQNEAVEEFRKALALAPNDWFVRWLAARIHYIYKKL